MIGRPWQESTECLHQSANIMSNLIIASKIYLGWMTFVRDLKTTAAILFQLRGGQLQADDNFIVGADLTLF